MNPLKEVEYLPASLETMHADRAAVLMYDLEKLPNLKELNIYKDIS
jgi:bacterioferritin (cytochrome b1)